VKVDYDTVAQDYDKYRGGGGPFVSVLAALAEAGDAKRVLELGAGTGSKTASFLKAYPCELTALDLSMGMLSKAAGKGLNAHLAQGDAAYIPLGDNSFDFIFGCYMLHHVTNLDAVFRECARVLERGCAAFITASHEFIQGHPINAYFPSFAAIDSARFQTLECVHDTFLRSGFVSTGEKRLTAPPAPISQAYVDRIAGKFISTYALIPQDEFDEGLARLQADVTAKGELDQKIEWESVTVWGSL
jgi:ubiquinone/menaquinone biosynthesis C-methylase UbiE